MRFISIYFSVLLLMLGCDDKRPERTLPTSSAASVASSAPAAVSAKPAPTVSASAKKAAPLYYERPIGPEDLAGRTLRELSLMRNTIYARAGNRFRRPWLNSYFSALDWYEPRKKMDESKITALDRKNAQAVAFFDAGLSTEELERRRDEVIARRDAGTASAEDRVELSLLSQRLGAFLGERDPNAPPTPLEDHTQLDKLVTVEQLSTMSRRDLRILRNTVYARRGRRFESKVVRSYFDTAAWYEPRDDFHDGLLTAVDNKNVKIIRSVEDSLGGPQHENPNYGKDGWFVMA